MLSAISPWGPTHSATAKQMHVQVKNSLPRVRVCIQYEAIAGFGHALAARELGGELRHLAENFGISHRARGRNVLAGNHEDVHWRLRIDVPERDAVVRLGDHRRLNLLPGNSAEEARVSHYPSVRASGAGHESAQYAGRDHTGRLEA